MQNTHALASTVLGVLSILGALISTTAVAAQSLVKDIMPGSGGSRPLDYPAMVDFYGTLFFAAQDPKHDDELWKTDGTASGTVLVKDIHPSGGSNPRQLTVVGRTLFFVARDNKHGWELWKTDGTAAGTVLVKDINPNQTSTLKPRDLTAVGNRVFFAANNGVHATELWVSDGTPSGTFMVKDISPGASSPQYLTEFGGLLYFSAFNNKTGRELWKSDGTAAGTVLVKDIYTGGFYFAGFLWTPYSSNPRQFAVIGNQLWFTAAGGSNTYSVFRTDGTTAGTWGIRAFQKGQFNQGLAHSYTAVGNTVFFNVGDHRGNELWKSDGSYAGTTLVKDINPGSGTSNPLYLTAHAGRVYFQAFEPVRGHELWSSDGTAAGTTVQDLRPGTGGSTPYQLTTVGSRGFCFGAEDKTRGKELWVSNGTKNGTILLADIRQGAGHSIPARFVLSGGRVFFYADDGKNGRELWKLEIGATAQSFGDSCGKGLPRLRATDPALGTTMKFVGEGAPTSAYWAYLQVGAPTLPFSLLGCDNIYYAALAAPVTLRAFGSTQSKWEVPLKVPNDPGLIGAVAVAQTAYLWLPDPLKNLRLTNGVRLTVGR